MKILFILNIRHLINYNSSMVVLIKLMLLKHGQDNNATLSTLSVLEIPFIFSLNEKGLSKIISGTNEVYITL